MARDNEQPLIAVDAPARPRVVDEWVEHLVSPDRRDLLLRVLRSVSEQWPVGGSGVSTAADTVVEKMFELPAGSGAALRAGLPLPDADERENTRSEAQEKKSTDQEREVRYQLIEAEQRAYREGYTAGFSEAKQIGQTTTTPTAPAPVTATPAAAPAAPTYTAHSHPHLSRKQRRALERNARRNTSS